MTQTFETNCLYKLMTLQNKIQKRLNGALTVHGISMTEYTVLLQLDQAPRQQMRRIDLAEQVGLSASGVTRLLNPMEKIGLVHKQANARDARVSLVALSSTGRQILQDAKTSVRQCAETLLAPLAPSEQAMFARYIDALQA